MDLSTGKRSSETRAAIIAAATVPIGTVPIYEALVANAARVSEEKTPSDL